MSERTWPMVLGTPPTEEVVMSESYGQEKPEVFERAGVPLAGPEKMSEIPTALQNLDENLSALFQEIDMLRGRLQSCLRPEGPQETQKMLDPRMVAGSELGEKLFNYASSIDGATLQLSQLTARIEL